MRSLRGALTQHRARRQKQALHSWQQNVLTIKFLSTQRGTLSDRAALTRTSTLYAIWRKVYIAEKFRQRMYQVCYQQSFRLPALRANLGFEPCTLGRGFFRDASCAVSACCTAGHAATLLDEH